MPFSVANLAIASALSARAHILAIAVVALIIVGLVRTGRALAGGPAQQTFERLVAGAVLLLYVGYVGWDLARGRFSITYSLPLQLCDFVALVAGAAFVTRRRWLHALAYFWGLALSTQALITPDVGGPPGSLTYVAFWLYHAFVVGAGVYVVAVHGFRPSLPDLGRSVALGIAWAMPVFLLDAATGWNYGYLGRALPETPTLLNHLGPWPARVGVMVLLAALAMAALWVPWALRRPPRPVATPPDSTG